jgi:hypothetical protein
MEKNKLLTCAQCGKVADKWCGKCKHVKYCNIECQRANWKFHKLVCKPLKSIETENFISLPAFGYFISTICYHTDLKRNEIIFCHAYKDSDIYYICATVQEKPSNISYHPTYHTSFVKLHDTLPINTPEEIDIVKFNVNPEDCKHIYDTITPKLGLDEYMNRNGMFNVEMDLKGMYLRNLEWQPGQ